MEPKVSVVIPIRKPTPELEKLLSSLDNQTYPDNLIERVIVTKEETNKDTRSKQRNIGIKKSTGTLILVTDHDYILEETLIDHSVEKIKEGYQAVTYFGTSEVTNQWRKFNFIPDWSLVRKAERDSYYMNPKYSAPSFFQKGIFDWLNPPGYDERLYSMEEYDLKNRIIKRGFKIGYIKDKAIHIGEPRSLREVVIKNIFYGENTPSNTISNPLRFGSWLKNKQDFADIRIAYGFPIYKFAQYSSALIGKIKSKITN